MEVAFERVSLRRVWGAAAVTVLGGVVVIAFETNRYGVPVSGWFRVPLGVLAILMGVWFAYAAAERGRSTDPAIRAGEETVLFHVNPGRRLVLRREDITGIGPLREVSHAPQRIILGDHVFEVTTTRPEGLRASAILVGSRFLAEDIAVVRDRLVGALDDVAGAGGGG